MDKAQITQLLIANNMFLLVTLVLAMAPVAATFVILRFSAAKKMGRIIELLNGGEIEEILTHDKRGMPILVRDRDGQITTATKVLSRNTSFASFVLQKYKKARSSSSSN